MNITLRLLCDDDYDAFHAIVSDFDVVKMTSSWPYPAEEEFTRMRMSTPEAKTGQVNAIEVNGEFAGVVGVVNADVGYLIGKAFWGRGVMTHALKMKTNEFFSDPSSTVLTSCVWHDNPASARVLEKNGFRKTGECIDFCKARNAEVQSLQFELTKETWLQNVGATPIPQIKTSRLELRPIRMDDAPAITNHLSKWSVMQWLSAPPWPYESKDAEWFVTQDYPTHWAIEAGNGLIGVIAFDPTLGYWLAAEEQGQGYMSEAVNAVLAWHFDQSDSPVISSHMPQNSASRRVLLKHGFTDTKLEKIFSRTHGRETDIQRMELTADRWQQLENRGAIA